MTTHCEHGFPNTIQNQIEHIHTQDNKKHTQCGARERHRKTCFTLANKSLSTTTLAHPFRLVHFGPHIAMEEKINQMTNIDQVAIFLSRI